MYSQYCVPSFFAFIFVFQFLQGFWMCLQDVDFSLPLTDLKLATPIINVVLTLTALIFELIRPGISSDYIMVDGRAVCLCFIFISLIRSLLMNDPWVLLLNYWYTIVVGRTTLFAPLIYYFCLGKSASRWGGKETIGRRGSPTLNRVRPNGCSHQCMEWVKVSKSNLETIDCF